MDLETKQLDVDQYPADNDVQPSDLKEESLQRDWTDLQERKAKRKFVYLQIPSQPVTQCVKDLYRSLARECLRGRRVFFTI